MAYEAISKRCCGHWPSNDGRREVGKVPAIAEMEIKLIGLLWPANVDVVVNSAPVANRRFVNNMCILD